MKTWQIAVMVVPSVLLVAAIGGLFYVWYGVNTQTNVTPTTVTITTTTTPITASTSFLAYGPAVGDYACTALPFTYSPNTAVTGGYNIQGITIEGPKDVAFVSVSLMSDCCLFKRTNKV
jgi:hypothetical protein